MSQPKFEFKSMLTRKLLDPARHKGSPFTFIHCRDTKEVFFTDAEGNYINFGSILAAVMNGSLPLALPASPVAGPQGRDGKDGKDSVVPGPQGIPGPMGPAGPQGSLLIPTDAELADAYKALRQKLARIQAKHLMEVERSEHLTPSTRAHVRNVLARIKQEIDL
jgi:hypothetical protein